MKVSGAPGKVIYSQNFSPLVHKLMVSGVGSSGIDLRIAAKAILLIAIEVSRHKPADFELIQTEISSLWQTLIHSCQRLLVNKFLEKLEMITSCDKHGRGSTQSHETRLIGNDCCKAVTSFYI